MKTATSAPEAPADTPTAAPWAKPAEAVLAAVASRPRGLSNDEALRRLAQNGPNRLPEPPRQTALARFMRQFNNLLILVLIAAAGITALLGHWLDTGVILAVVLANTVIGFVQEGRAEQALEALRDMLAPKASLWRDGVRVTVPAADLVVGDVVWLEAGDRVPADLRLIAVQGLTVEEAILTGESVPVRKQLAPVAPDAALGDRLPMLFSGTMVAEGSGTGVVTATGADSEIGRISTMMGEVQELTTPLIRQMAVFARYLTGIIIALSGLILAFAVFLRGMAFPEAFMVVVGLFVAAIPEGLPAVLTVTLAIGVQTMARRHAIVRRLPSIETLGAVSVICSDKTGTLTRNEMTVTHLVTAEGRHEVTGTGYAPEGDLLRDGAKVQPGRVLRDLGRVAALCNTAQLHEAPQWRVEGDPMEGALLALAGKLGASPGDAALSVIPFDARYRYMAVLHDLPEGRFALIKGAPEQLLDRASLQATADGSQPLDRQFWLDAAEETAAQGMRVLALALKPHDGDRLGHDDLDQGLVLLGLTGLIDPPRDEAIVAVRECHEAGIAVKMITGDHAGTAAAIGRQIGLKRTDTVLTGADLDRLDDLSLQGAVVATDVFARTSPEHKLRLVSALQAQGAVVAMTGDGVNDAPALKRADAGIAMGQKGSEAARQAADLVLTDDNFASIAEAVRQGRTVYGNLKKVITFLLPVNGGESLSLVLALMLGLVLPITPLQILWVNMISSVALAMALAFEPAENQVMRRPPRRPDAPIVSRFILWRVLLVSILFTIGVFGQFALELWLGGTVEAARTMAVNTLVAMEVFYLFSVRYRHGASLTWQGAKGTRAVLMAVGLVVMLQAIFTYLPPMQRLFGTVALSPLQLLECAGAGVLLLLVLELDKRAAAHWKSLRDRAVAAKV
ncbi:cation-translocating P-type ATPase [Plastorhodobacter daqingensis]|uniref:Cation-translocating P-type ATPase n=1 Tax=Plastorhodobacter daqingensis TaxID=1387281 RepID=A0ABW2UI95_9RHOB